jgi:hypothetical protein
VMLAYQLGLWHQWVRRPGGRAGARAGAHP